MKAIVLAAGYATRLYPLTFDKPKALLPVKDKPILNYIVEKIEEINEVDKIFIVTNDKFYMNFVWWLKQYQGDFRKEIEIINDSTTTNETRLGGIGDLWFALKQKKINDDILVVASDNLFDFSLKGMADFFMKNNKTTAGIYDIGDMEEVKKMSIVKIENGKITFFEEKPQNPFTTLSCIAVYIFPKSDLNKIKEYMKTDKPKDGPGFLIQHFSQQGDVHAFILQGRWFDIGSIETYSEVNNNWEK